MSSEYLSNLRYLSGGKPFCTFSDKIAYYAVFFMNAISYDEKKAKDLVEQSRRLTKISRLESF